MSALSPSGQSSEIGITALLLSAVLLAAGCSVEEPLQSMGGFGDSQCAACLSTSCRAELLACQSDIDCQRYLACLAHCPLATSGDVNPDCQKHCADDVQPSSRWRVDQLSSCQASGKTALACPDCGRKAQLSRLEEALNQDCPAGPPEDTTCGGCLQTKCCKSKSDCMNDPDCSALVDCMAKCPQDDKIAQCRAECSLNFQKGRLKLARLELCTEARCNAPCLAPTSATPACDPCVARECPDAVLDYYSDLDALQFTDCGAYCEFDFDCMIIADCIPAGTDWQKKWNFYVGCQANRCSRVCKTDGALSL